MKGHLDVKELEKYKKADLQKLAEELGVSTEGTIKELAERCAEVEVEIPDESELTEEEKEAAEQAAAGKRAGRAGKGRRTAGSRNGYGRGNSYVLRQGTKRSERAGRSFYCKS